MRPDGATLVDALAAANVQFVVVGDVSGPDPLRVVVSRHPTNLDALSRALDRLGATLSLAGPEGMGGPAGGESAASTDTAARAAGRATGPERVGDPLGTMTVDTAFGGLTLMFGGPSTSLYAETVAVSEPVRIGERSVAWAAAPAAVASAPRTTGRALGRRLLSLVEGLTHLVEQRASGDRDADRRANAKDNSDVDEAGSGPGTTTP